MGIAVQIVRKRVWMPFILLPVALCVVAHRDFQDVSLSLSFASITMERSSSEGKGYVERLVMPLLSRLTQD